MIHRSMREIRARSLVVLGYETMRHESQKAFVHSINIFDETSWTFFLG